MRKPFDGDFVQTQNWNDSRYRASYYQFGLLGHNGEDYDCPAWTPILAPHSGIIKEAAFDSGYGNYVKVESEDEGSVLAHLSKISVSVGDQVQEGQLIGYSGNTGNSTGSHLHWGYYRTATRDRDNGFAGFIDQTDWLDRVIITQPIAGMPQYLKTLLQENNLTNESQVRDFFQKAISYPNLELDLNNARKEIEKNREAYNKLLKEYQELEKAHENPSNAIFTPDSLTTGELINLLINKIRKYLPT